MTHTSSEGWIARLVAPPEHVQTHSMDGSALRRAGGYTSV